MKHQNYFTRALKAHDRRFGRVFGKMGYATTDMVADDAPAVDIADVRAEYLQVVGKRPFNGWDVPTLLTKIAEAKRG